MPVLVMPALEAACPFTAAAAGSTKPLTASGSPGGMLFPGGLNPLPGQGKVPAEEATEDCNGPSAICGSVRHGPERGEATAG